MKFPKSTKIGLSTALVLLLNGCTNENAKIKSEQYSNNSQTTETQSGYSFTGETNLGVSPYDTNPDLSSLVIISDENLKPLLNYDIGKVNEVQQAELRIVDTNDEIIAHEVINVFVRPTGYPTVEVAASTEPMQASDFSIDSFINAYIETGNSELETIPLSWISAEELVNKKAGYVVYDSDTGVSVVPGTIFTDGEYEISILASDGMGLSLLKGPITFTLAN